MKITAATVGRRENRTKEVSMATFFLQDPKYDLEIHHKRWSSKLPGAILFKAVFDKLLLSDRLWLGFDGQCSSEQSLWLSHRLPWKNTTPAVPANFFVIND